MLKDIDLNKLTEIGKIKIGRKSEKKTTTKTGKEMNLIDKMDYFLITTLRKDEIGNFMPDYELMKKCDPANCKPRMLEILLPYDDIDLNFFTYYGIYVGHRVICKGDGEKAIRLKIDKELWKSKKEWKVKEENSIPCKGMNCEEFQKGRCKKHGILSVILLKNVTLGGVYQFRTSGNNSVDGILRSLKLISDVTNGILQGLKLRMYINPATKPDRTGVLRNIYVVNIQAEANDYKILANEVSAIAAIRAQSARDIKMLEAKVKEQVEKREASLIDTDEDIDEGTYTPVSYERSPEGQSDINEEFSPNTLDEEPFLEEESSEETVDLPDIDSEQEIPPPPSPPSDEFQMSDSEKNPKYNGLPFEDPRKADEKLSGNKHETVGELTDKPQRSLF